MQRLLFLLLIPALFAGAGVGRAPRIKLKVTFKLSEMLYEGKLEY